MSLISFHRFLIAAAIIFCGGFAIWELFAFVEGGGLSDLALAVAFGAAAAGFGYYLRNLSRFLKLSTKEQRPPGDLAD